MEFLLIFLLSLIPRLIFLFFSMPSITHDEADYFLNSYMLAKTGTDFWENKFFLTSGLLSATSSIPVYLNAIVYLFFPKNIIFSRLIFTIINIFTPIFFYYLIKKLTKNKSFSFFSFLVLNFSPWFLYLSSQINFDSIISFSFLIFSFYFLINLNSLPLFFLSIFLSFNSYMGIKTSMFFLILISLMVYHLSKYKRINIKKIIKIISLSLFIYIILLSLSYFLPNNQLIKERTKNDLIFFNKEKIENFVWFERLTTNGPDLLRKIFSNKITVLTKFFLNNFFLSINPSILFLKGDPHPIYGNNIFGLFYLWQIVFFIYGLIRIKEMPNLKLLWPLLLIIIFGSIPTIVSSFEPTIALRSFPIIIPYSLIIANGIYQFVNQLHNKKTTYLFYFLFFISFINFFMLFNFRIKVLSSEQWHLGEKKIFEKVIKKDKNKNIYIVNNEPKETFMLFSFYHINDGFLIKKKIQNKDYSYKNIFFTDKKISFIKDGIILIKRGSQNIDKEIKEKIISGNHYLEASDKSGVLYYILK